jgi:hypothetical protein
VLGAVGAVQGPVDGGRAFASQPLLVVLAFAPIVVAGGLLLARRAGLAGGVLAGAGLLAPARALLDLQFLVRPVDASRPELFVPTNLGDHDPTVGLWLLLGGHVAATAAGALAAAGKVDDVTSSVAARGRAMGWALALATVTVAGLLLQPYRSDNAFLLAVDVIGSPAVVRIGGLVLAITVILGGVLAAGASRVGQARGTVLGLAIGLVGLTLPPLVAALTVDWLHPERWAYLALIPLPLLAVLMFTPLTSADSTDPETVRLEADPLHRATGVLGVLTGLAALGGALFPQLVVDAGLDQPANYANRQLAPVGVLLVVLGVALFTRWATVVRPAFVVTLASVVLVGTAALDAAFTGDSVSPLVHLGAGVWFVGAAVVLSALAAVVAAIAGGAERDDVDLTEREPNNRLMIPLGIAGALAIGAFGLPMIKADGFVAPGIWTEFRLASWGLLTALVVVVVAAAIAVNARPARATALLAGATVVVAVHLLEWPLTIGRAEGAAPDNGTWFTVACAVVLVASAVFALVPKKAKAEPAEEAPEIAETPEPRKPTTKAGKQAKKKT